MAGFKIGSGYCYECRDHFAGRGDVPPCDFQEACVVTQLPPDDPRAPMVNGEACAYIIEAYEQIAAISTKARRERAEGSERVILSLPTLEKIELWMSLTDWEAAPVTREQFVKYISVFHNAYIGSV